MNNVYLPTTSSKKKCFVLLVLLFGLYILDNSSIVLYFDSHIYNNILKPMLWLGVVLIVLVYPRVRINGKIKLRGFTYWWAFNLSIVYVIVSVIAGLVDGFGKSPYSHTISGILLNTLTVGTALLGRELIRSYLVNALTKKENYLLFVLITIFITFTSLPLKQYFRLEDYESTVIFIARYIAPAFSKNLFATYLAFIGGPLASILYMGVLQAFHWLSPILPDLKWITTALIGTLCPIFSLFTFQNMYLSELKDIKRNEKDEESPLGWLITSIVSIFLIWFAVGVFPIYPSVIATGSMEPIIKPGDVILVKKITNIDGVTQLRKGDVIQFKRDSILISHRIIQIIEDEKEGIIYKTKGDNNSASDREFVKPEQIKGKIVHVIPKVGWPTLLIKSKEDIPLEEIVF